ncbi:TonB-dependent receptor [Natronospira bacteriovora]|uniref:TonB-dependent receptor n=1 Tax=Natronospira bacteriovora TaxID=3069753 RepID=A0ABU0W7I5_9GAMM|nr:TonB-dependent receptor [Natronospira sp. AB-CW4]MDQ2069951.1 TonB-dependent receptor [Natronospira sp. AB-CW4]
MRTKYSLAKLSGMAAMAISVSLISSTVVAEDDNLRMDDVIAQAETPEAQQRRQSGPARDPLDPAPARTRAMQLGGGDQAVTSGTQFNPAISVILDGIYYNEFSGHVESPGGFDAGHGHGHGHDHGHGGHGFQDGFQMRDVEFAFSATVDPYFDAFVMFTFENGSVDLEEAFISTRALPAGLQLKAGRFLSDIGYINKQHPHDWAFVDRPWMNEYLFGDHGLLETGVQMSWMPATRSYTRFGVELLNGESSGVAPYIGSGNHEMVTVLPNDPENDDFSPNRNRWRASNGFDDVTGPRLATAFAKWAPDLGYDHALQLGAFAGWSEAYQRDEAHSSGRYETWDGDASFWGVDAVYKRDGGGTMGHRNFTLQFEYAMREIDALYMSRQFTDFSTLEPTTRNPDGDVVNQRWKQDGFYLQGTYGFAPRWNWGLRVEGMGLTNDAYADHSEGRGLPTPFESSWRYSTQLTYAPTEFSRIRAQLNYLDVGDEAGHHDHEHHDAWEFMLQYNISIGVHGAHTF